MSREIQYVGGIDADWMSRWADGRLSCVRYFEWDWVTEAIEDLRKNYGEKWGDDYEPVNQECVTSMVALLAHLKVAGFPPPWTVYGLPDGGVEAEWSFDVPDRETAAVRLEVENKQSHIGVLMMSSRPRKAEAMFTTGMNDPAVFGDIEF